MSVRLASDENNFFLRHNGNIKKGKKRPFVISIIAIFIASDLDGDCDIGNRTMGRNELKYHVIRLVMSLEHNG